MVYHFIIGTYTHIAQAPASSRGVYLYQLDTATMQATCLDSIEVKNASWVTIDGTTRAFTLSECGNESLLHSIAIDGDTIQLTSTIPCPGDDPCHLAVRDGMLYAANYSSGSISAIKIKDDGTLGKTVQEIKFDDHGTSPRQLSAHLHNIALNPSGCLMAASNLGGDCVYLLHINPDGTLTPLHTQHTHCGSGPRHLAWSQTGNCLYLITELSDEVMTFALENNELRLLQTLTAARTPGHGAGHIALHPSGKWVYASVRLVDDGIAMFKVPPDGTLERQAFYSTGRHPRHFAITPCGTLLLAACRNKNAIEIYRINPADGTLSHMDKHDISINLPVCIGTMSAVK